MSRAAPPHPDDRLLLLGAALAGLAASAFLVHGDPGLVEALGGSRPAGVAFAVHVASWAGNWAVLSALLAVGAAAGHGLDRPRLRAAGIGGLAGIAIAGLVVQAVKLATCRARPSVALAGTFRLRVCLEAGLDSFPSGHAAHAFAVAAILAAVYPRVAAPAYLVAALVALSRVALGLHFPSDVLAGAAVGLGFGVLGRRLVRRLAPAGVPAPSPRPRAGARGP